MKIVGAFFAGLGLNRLVPNEGVDGPDRLVRRRGVRADFPCLRLGILLNHMMIQGDLAGAARLFSASGSRREGNCRGISLA